VIDAELSRKDRSSIPRSYNREGAKPLDTRTDSEPD
jgi:hypothetical protein